MRRTRRGSITLITLVVLTFSLFLLYYVDDYYGRQKFDYQNLIYYYQKQNNQLRQKLKDAK